ncbi:MAG: hypothetical protein ACT4SY_11695 [Hyphomicrobiales bacterium]
MSGMIEYDGFIYLDVNRTGSTHLLALLDLVTGSKRVRAHRHSSLTRGRPWGHAGGKLVFATVRNPWDWYVSLWAYGADGRSSIRKYLSRHLDIHEMARLYNRESPADSFRQWLSAMNDPPFLAKVMGERLPQSGLAPVLGLYSYRFLRVTTRFPRLLLRSPIIRKPRDAIGHLRRFGTFDEILHTENLASELIDFVERNQGRCNFRPDAADCIRNAENRHRNASRRSLGSYRDYYDDRTAALVAARDPLFVELFGYRF